MSGGSSAIDGRENNFDGLRLIAALLVLVGHAFVLTGAGPAPRIGGIPLHTFGVCVFFAISGYLIAGSWQRGPSVVRYLSHRVLRIFPALIVVVVITTFLIGPAVTSLSLSNYFGESATWRYLANLTLLGQYDLPGVFADGSHPRDAVNGSLWTLGVEFACYLGLLAVVVALPRLRPASLVVATVLTAIAATLAPDLEFLAAAGPALEMATFFFAAASMRYLVPPGRFGLLPGSLAFIAWLAIAILIPGATWPTAWVLVTYAMIALGRASLPGLRRAGRFGDLSYGLYLWAYPVQQLVISAAGVLPLTANIAIVAIVSLALALVSWHVIEKRALRLKDVAPVLTRSRAIVD